jgi:superoxide dismutase, Cu-Zn family
MFILNYKGVLFMKKRSILSNLVAGCALVILISGCACSDSRKPTTRSNEIAAVGSLETKETKDVKSAFVNVKGFKDNKITGKITFTQQPDGVLIVGDVDGLTPGKHGFHVHEHGDCSASDGSSAGAHFNPTNKKHGGPDDPDRHVGDLGNMVADANGHAHYQRVDKVISLNGKDTIVGLSIIIHADEDDYKTQPTGASGTKIACGIIEAK